MGRDDRRYLHQVRRALRGTGKQKKQVLAQVQSSVSEYQEENPDCSYSDLVQRFGVPQQIAESYITEMDPKELLFDLRIRQRTFSAVCAGIILCLTMWLGYLFVSYHMMVTELNGKVIPGEITVDEVVDIERYDYN